MAFHEPQETRELVLRNPGKDPPAEGPSQRLLPRVQAAGPGGPGRGPSVQPTLREPRARCPRGGRAARPACLRVRADVTTARAQRGPHQPPCGQGHPAPQTGGRGKGTCETGLGVLPQLGPRPLGL